LKIGESWADEIPDLPTAPARASQPDYGAPAEYGNGGAPVGVPRTGGAFRGGDRERPRHPRFDRSRDRSRERPSRPKNPLPDRPPYCAYLGNLGFGLTEDEIAEFFQGLKVSAVKLREIFY
jgi:translation initiation factor 4B